MTTDQGHTPEPWKVVDTYRVVQDTGKPCPREIVGTTISGECDVSDHDNADAANARRFTACVNACKGIADPPALRTSHDQLWRELDRLAGEVQACWGMNEPQLRRELGNTNYQAVADRLVTSKAALTKPSATLTMAKELHLLRASHDRLRTNLRELIEDIEHHGHGMELNDRLVTARAAIKEAPA